jgi:hypothetical protein
MAQTLQHRRNTTVGLQTENGSEGEIFMDTTKKTLVVMDGVTNGGTPLAKESDIPTAVSELTNDAGYITSNSLPTSVSELTNDAGYITSNSLPTAVSELTNDAGYLTSVAGFTYNEGGGTSELGVTADVFDFGDGKTIDMQNSTVLFANSTISGVSLSVLDVENITVGVAGGINMQNTSISSANTIDAVTVNAVDFNGNLTGNVTGDVTGNVTGDVTGNIFSSANSLLVDSANSKIFGTIDTDSITFDDDTVQTTAYPGPPTGFFNGNTGAFVLPGGNVVFQVDGVSPVAVVDANGFVGSVSSFDGTLLVDGVDDKIVGQLDTTGGFQISGLFNYGVANTDQIVSGDIWIHNSSHADGRIRIVSNTNGLQLDSVGGTVNIGDNATQTTINGVVNIGTTSAGTVTIGDASQSNNTFYGTLNGNIIEGLAGSDLTITGFENTGVSGSGGDVVIDGGNGPDDFGVVKINQNTTSGVWIGKTDGTAGDIQTYSRLQIHRGVIEPYRALVNATGVVNHDCDDGHLFYHLNPSANWTVNLINLRSFNTMATTISIVVEQGATGYLPLLLQIGGSAQTIKWLNSSIPAGQSNKTEIVTFTLFDKGTGYEVLGECRTYG